MSADFALLQEKIDQLTSLVNDQNQRLRVFEEQTSSNGLVLEKLEYLTQQFETQRRQQEELSELKEDLIPIANHMIKLSIDELAEIGSEFQLEDLLFLLKRLLRDTHLLMKLLDRLEATMELADELQVVGKQAFHQATETLDQLEREGYFTFARSGWRIVERVVSEFNEADIEALGENIVTILATVRNLTQPEMMALTNKALHAIQDESSVENNASLWSLLRDLSDPKVRKGMARLLNLIRLLAEQPNTSSN